MNEFGLSLLQLMDEKAVDFPEFVDRMDGSNRRKARRGCPFYSVDDVVAFMRVKRAEDLPHRGELRVAFHMVDALGLDDAEGYERIYKPIMRSISLKYRDRWSNG